jgi:hypothetical protein
MIVGFALPEGLAGAGKSLVGCPGSRPFYPLERFAGFLAWTKEDMNVIGHDYEGAQVVESDLGAAFESLYDQGRYGGIAQEHWTFAGGVQIAVHPDECAFGGGLLWGRVESAGQAAV